MSGHGFRTSQACGLIAPAVDTIGHNSDRIRLAAPARDPPTGRPAIVSRFRPILSKRTKITAHRR